LAVTQRQDGRFVGTLQVHGKRKFVYRRSEAEVRRKLATLQRDTIITGGVPTPGRRTVNDLLDAWLKACMSTLKPKTLVGYQDTARWYIRPTLGHVQLSRLEPMHVQNLYSKLASDGLKRIPAQAHAVFHRACKLGVMWGWLGRNPCDHVLPPRYSAQRKHVWSPEDTSRFLSTVVNDRHGPLFLFLVLTGVRLGEALALTWDDVGADTITIRRTVTHLNGGWVVTTPKTQAGDRTLAMSTSLLAAIEQERARQADRCQTAGDRWHGRELVFSTRSGNYIFRGEVAAALRSTCDRLALPRLTPHGLRHLSASLLLANNVPLPNVSRRLGHANPSITARLYSHAVSTDFQAAEALEELVLSRPNNKRTTVGDTHLPSPASPD
jgi:integrase